jgi:hypothetical protein
MFLSELSVETEQTEDANRVIITFRPVLVEDDE